MNMDDYPHFFLIEDGRLCSTGQHCPGFPRVLYDALLHLGYKGEVSIYCCRLSMVDGLDICETNMMIPLNPTEPWTGTVVGSEHDTTVDQTAHVVLISLCESRLVATAAMLNVLFLSQNQKSPLLKQHLEAMSDLEGPHFNTGMAAMAMYV
jgi:hypothetical protein